MKNTAGVTIDNIFYTLEDLEKDTWLRLLNGALKSKDAFHTASVATLRADEISLRTVVLRKVIQRDKQLRFHTDTRSNKWKELEQNNAISMLFYGPSARVQLRVSGVAVLHYQDEITDLAWQNTSLSSRRIYLTSLPPSSYIDLPADGLEGLFENGNPTLLESEAGKQNFGVINVQVSNIDWLWLNHAGHRRAFFNYENQEYNWVAP